MIARFWVCLLLSQLLLSPSGASAELLSVSESALKEALAVLEISDPEVSVTASPRRGRSPAGAKPFTRRQADAIGIDVMEVLEPADFAAPIWNGRGLAAGDVDRDGYKDILVASKRGVRLFMNRAELGFRERELDIPALAKLEVHVVGLVDINNDGWLDIFLTSYRTGIYYVFSDKGEFTSAGLVKAPEHPTVVAESASFGDLDEDGDLDLAIGNFYLGRAKVIPAVDATNKILFNENGKFRVTALTEAIVGDTHTILLSDFNHDGHLDLIVGNDFKPPDFFYLGNGKGALKLIKKSDGIIPVSTHTTMSIDTADYNNDLRLDIFLTQIAAGGTGASARVRARPLKRYCQDLAKAKDKAACQRALDQKNLFKFFSKWQPGDILTCRTIQDYDQRLQCAAMMTWMLVIRSHREELCERMPASQSRPRFLCSALFKPSHEGSEKQYAESIEIVMNENALLRASGDGSFQNVAQEAGVAVTGFSWNAKFADLDNDGWQDVYVVNGSWASGGGTPQKFFYRNVLGTRFEEAADEFGLQNFMLQSAYVTADFDNDGDLDMLVNTISGPIWFYRNNDNRNNAILFEIRDHKANRYCVGCKIRVFHGAEGDKAQLREIKSGGGFLSFDAATAHFGLGSDTSVARVEIDWSTGGTTTIQGPLPANVLYTIRRGGRDRESEPELAAGP